MFALLVVALTVWYFVLPQFGQAEEAFEVVAGINIPLVLLGTALVATAIAAQAVLTQRVLPPAERPTTWTMLRLELATTAVSHTVPGGTAAGTALAYRLLTQMGVSGAAAGFALGVRGIGSAVVLNGLLWTALLISIPTRGFDPRYTTAALLGILLLALVGGLMLGLLRAQDATTRVLCRITRPLPVVDTDALPDTVARLAGQLRDLVGDRRLAVITTSYASVYWFGQAAALWLLLHALGWTGDPISVLVAFGIVNVLAAAPVTPRGLGVVEAVLIPMLVGFGAPGYVATLGVIGWRLLSFWAPIPLGSVSYVSLRLGQPDVREQTPSAITRELVDTGVPARQSRAAWAERHCLRRPR